MKLSRRDIIKAAAALSATGGIAAFVTAQSPPHAYLRPPGAALERDFLRSCIKCGQCVQVCPYHSVKLADAKGGRAMGTPLIEAEKRGCYLCDLFPCVLACPTGALEHSLERPEQVRMGRAEIADVSRCYAASGRAVTKDDVEELLRGKPLKTDVERELAASIINYQGAPCKICQDFCPYPNRAEAIEFAPYGGWAAPVIGEKCVGCGVCAELCPAKIIHIKARF